jgi:hypothetical protein
MWILVKDEFVFALRFLLVSLNVELFRNFK